MLVPLARWGVVSSPWGPPVEGLYNHPTTSPARSNTSFISGELIIDLLVTRTLHITSLSVVGQCDYEINNRSYMIPAKTALFNKRSCLVVYFCVRGFILSGMFLRGVYIFDEVIFLMRCAFLWEVNFLVVSVV